MFERGRFAEGIARLSCLAGDGEDVVGGDEETRETLLFEDRGL